MLIRKGLVVLLMFFASQCFSQTGLNLKLGASAWHFVSEFEDLSNPMSLAYSGGLNLEQVLVRSRVGIMTGLEYQYANSGTNYIDLSDQKNLAAVIYQKKFNERYINVAHHEISIPFMFVFYHNGFRSGAGASYTRYLFNNQVNENGPEQLNGYGLNFCTGARLSKRILFSIGYYYGLNKVINVQFIPERDPFQANMQQITFHIAYSLFNNFEQDKYFIYSN